MSHAFVSIAVPFRDFRREDVECAIDALTNDARDLLHPELDAAGFIHFMSISLVDADPGGDHYLVFEISADGTEDDVLALLDTGKHVGPRVKPVLEAAGSGGQSAKAFLSPHVIRTGSGLLQVPGLNFTGTPGLSVDRIKREAILVAQLTEEIAEARPSGSAKDLVNHLKMRVAESERFAKVRDLLDSAEPVPFLIPQKIKGLSVALAFRLFAGATKHLLWPLFLIAALIAFVRVWPTLVEEGFFAAIWPFVWRFAVWSMFFVSTAYIIIIGALSRREKNEEPDDALPEPNRLRDVRSREDTYGLQNHLFGVSRMKPGILRAILLRFAFWLIAYTATNVYRPGHLRDIGTIHFARWFRIPGSDKLIFCSNYGGSWESYLEDFITKAPNGLTAVWSNTVGFPKTRLLFGRGARQANAFKRWARRQQFPTRFWYVAYPHLTTDRIRMNAAIRNGLVSAVTEDEARAVMSMFGSRPKPENMLEKDEIQTLLMSGLGRHRQSACTLIRLPDDQAAARAWLRGRLGRVGHGERPGLAVVDQIALSAHALRRLGHDALLDEFPFAFEKGMEARARALGDIGQDAPERWKWGNSSAPVDVAILTYVEPDKRLTPDPTDGERAAHAAALREKVEAEIAALRDEVGSAGGEVIQTIVTINLDDRERKPEGKKFAREFFGFADGVSQPRIRGLRPYRHIEDEQHILAPGEFVLGYPDNRGQRGFAARVPSLDDPDNILPVVGADHGRANEPDLAMSGINAARDLGRNGSYLVIRQLAQHKETFEHYLEDEAKRISDHEGIPPATRDDPERLEHYIAAKMVGRWRDGSSLVVYPNAPATGWDGDGRARPDNNFLLGRDDPSGLACPYGSHIRRTNPRDSLNPNSPDQIDISNRHRILRRGRFFESDPSDNSGQTEGLLFMCANADIERQFEFIQQTWMMAPQFHGAYDEVDPLFAGGERSKRMTIPTEKGPVMLCNMQRFVSMVGGEYFFLPSKAALRYLSS